MSTFKNIPIRVEETPASDDRAVARAILSEIQTLLERLVEDGRAATIDLRGVLPMGPEGYLLLKNELSIGEVKATINGFGRTEIHETSYAGVWWVTHRNGRDEIVTELIEVTHIPDILKSQPEDVQASLRRMRANALTYRPQMTKGYTDLP